MQPRAIFLFLLPFLAVSALSAQVASRTDGVTVVYYDSLREAFNTAAGVSIERPDEITLLADIVLDDPLIVDDGRHIRLVSGNSARTVHRGPDLIDFPVIWVKGDSSSLTLGKPGTEFELVVDGGFLNSPPIEAHCPLVAVSGPDSKFIIYDNVTLQNNKNSGNPSGTSHYQNGAGVFIRTEGDIRDRQAEFIMKGGTIRGNINNIETPMNAGGGVFIAGFGIFTMEGGVITGNTARLTGGGLHSGGRGSFRKTGGVIYGSNAPAGYRNTATNGVGTLKTYGHAVCVAYASPPHQYRNDTVAENDTLSYITPQVGGYSFGTGEKWDNPDKALRRMLVTIILPVLPLAVGIFLILRKRALQRLMRIAKEAADTAPEAIFENLNLTAREKEVGPLLLTELSMNQISSVMKLTYATADYHAKKLYRKLGVKSREELLIRVKKMSNEQGAMSNEK